MAQQYERETVIAFPELDSMRDLDGEDKTTIMKIRTSKGYNGGAVETGVMVVTRDDGFITFKVFGDYMVTVKRKEAKRVTKKAVDTMHDSITEDDIAYWKNCATDHYVEKLAKKALLDAA